MTSIPMDSLFANAQFELTCPQCSSTILVQFQQLDHPIICAKCKTEIMISPK